MLLREMAGRLEVICGCMFAGKTTALIRRLADAAAAGHCVRGFKHTLDTRYHPTHIASHDAARWEAFAADDAAAILARSAGAGVIGIDEVHFFGRAVLSVCMALRAAGCVVIVAGIDHDAWGRSFPPLRELAALADEVRVLTAPCTRCTRPARFSQRLVPLADAVMVGGRAEYAPRCAACFEPVPAPPVPARYDG